jgi:hypothetical protein
MGSLFELEARRHGGDARCTALHIDTRGHQAGRQAVSLMCDSEKHWGAFDADVT